MDDNKKYRVDLPNADHRLRERCIRAAKGLYGDPLPELVNTRLTMELDAITENHYSSDYLIATELADCSKRAGYPVMSRGMAGSSLTAYMCGFTSVNPLPAHYICPQCYHFETAGDEMEYRISGFDLEEKACPICGELMKPDGHNILPEFYMGKYLNKEPDIVLNFAPEIRPAIIRHIKKEYFDEQIYRAGTCSTDSKGTVNLGVHPGGIFIFPSSVDISNITQIRPNDAVDEFQMDITVRDYHDLWAKMQKYDILTLPVLGMLYDLGTLTGYPEQDIPMTNKIIEIFLSSDVDYIPLVSREEKKAIQRVKPKGFADLARVSGLLHGTDSWWNNANNLVEKGVKLQNMICSRDDIMQELLQRGMNKEDAYDIMNHVRRGKGLTSEMKISMMRDIEVPDWYIQSCEHITYLFPKSHIVEYTILQWKMAWYLKHYPEEYQRVYEKWYGDATV